jgi:hypothetical protein
MVLSHSLKPLSDSNAEVIRANLVEYWKAAAQCEGLTGILGDFVHETEAKVTELLQRNEVETVYEALRLTVQFDTERQPHS